MTPIKHTIPPHLAACITTHRIIDDPVSMARLATWSAIRAAIETMAAGQRFAVSDIKNILGDKACSETIRTQLKDEVTRGALTTHKTGQNRYYKRVA